MAPAIATAGKGLDTTLVSTASSCSWAAHAVQRGERLGAHGRVSSLAIANEPNPWRSDMLSGTVAAPGNNLVTHGLGRPRAEEYLSLSATLSPRPRPIAAH